MVRTPTFDNNGIKKGAWSLEEDRLLRDYINRYGHWNWRELPKFAGLKRCGKSCRLRWMNYLRPNLKHGNYTKEEENLIIEMHLKHGNKWAILASKLPGRTDNEIKNYWHTHLKKRVKPETSTYKTQPEPRHTNKSMNNQLKDSISDHDIQILESCPILSPEMASSSTSTLSSYEISTTAFDDDGGLEEIINSTELFSELSTSLSPLGNEFMDNDELQDADFWRNIFVNNSEEAVLSPYVNYDDDDLLDLLNMEEFLEG